MEEHHVNVTVSLDPCILEKFLELQYRILRKLDEQGEQMGATGLTLAQLQQKVNDLATAAAAQKAASDTLIADVDKLLANTQPGPQPGQVIVNQSDIEALGASVDALQTAVTTETAAEVAEDAKANPAAPATGTGVNQA